MSGDAGVGVRMSEIKLSNFLAKNIKLELTADWSHHTFFKTNSKLNTKLQTDGRTDIGIRTTNTILICIILIF